MVLPLDRGELYSILVLDLLREREKPGTEADLAKERGEPDGVSVLDLLRE
jgi:hypothetical protein